MDTQEQNDYKDQERALLAAVQAQCDTWIHALASPHIDKMYATIKQGKMLRSKLIIAIAAPHAQQALESSQAPESKEQRESAPLDSAPHANSIPESNVRDSIIKLCAVIELIQCASLLHDDVIDSATSRRGAVSVNAAFGDKNAIMLGDVLYSSAFVQLCSFPAEIARVVAESVSALSKGEIADVACSGSFQPDLETYYQILRDKTAALIAASAKAAALLLGLDARAYEAYGLNLGMAFQIIDDLLDITQDERTLGKPALNDIKEGKSTLPYILLYGELDSSKQQEFLDCFARADSHSIAQIQAMLASSSALDRTKHIAQDFIHKALESIQHEHNHRLESIARALIERSY